MSDQNSPGDGAVRVIVSLHFVDELRMPTWALYLDESGDANSHSVPLKVGETPVFALAGTALPLSHWRAYQSEYSSLKLQFFKNEIDKSSKSQHQWELKGNRLVAPRNADSQRLAGFAHKTLDLVENNTGRLFSVAFLKCATKPTSHISMYTKALQILAEAFDIFLREKSETARGIIILDSRMAHLKKGSGLDYTVATGLLSYVFGNELGRQLKRLQEAPLFADSCLTSGIQIADIVAGLMYANTYRINLSSAANCDDMGYLNYAHVERFWPHLLKLKYHSASQYNGYFKTGFRFFDHRKEKSDNGDTEVEIG
jgi:hypothetical protein